MNENLKEAKETLRDLIAGIGVYAVLLMIVTAIIPGKRYNMIFGILMGAVGAVFLAVHMFWSLNRSLDMDEDGAIKRERLMVIFRMIIMGAIAATGVIFPDKIHILGIFLGLLGLKISAYLQPVLHNYILKSKEKKEGR